MTPPAAHIPLSIRLKEYVSRLGRQAWKFFNVGDGAQYEWHALRARDFYDRSVTLDSLGETAFDSLPSLFAKKAAAPVRDHTPRIQPKERWLHALHRDDIRGIPSPFQTALKSPFDEHAAKPLTATH
ncbi:MAG TPA: hypothetical protein VHF05_00775 [Candidatus Paceibacterota bacterium]|jgi:hypothetical protein|nr:hypothetical protein [Candidatus Paceibacterota bacterium]